GSKTRRVVWLPGAAARQPRASPETNADSTGQSLSSDVTSTMAARSTSNQLSARVRVLSGVGVMSRFRIYPVYYSTGGSLSTRLSEHREDLVVCGKL